MDESSPSTVHVGGVRPGQICEDASAKGAGFSAFTLGWSVLEKVEVERVVHGSRPHLLAGSEQLRDRVSLHVGRAGDALGGEVLLLRELVLFGDAFVCLWVAQHVVPL